MDEQTVAAYDTAAATLQHALETAYPGYAWGVPNSYDALLDETRKELLYGGWLFVRMSRRGYMAQMKVTVGIEKNAAAVQAIAERMIEFVQHLYNQDKT